MEVEEDLHPGWPPCVAGGDRALRLIADSTQPITAAAGRQGPRDRSCRPVGDRPLGRPMVVTGDGDLEAAAAQARRRRARTGEGSPATPRMAGTMTTASDQSSLFMITRPVALPALGCTRGPLGVVPTAAVPRAQATWWSVSIRANTRLHACTDRQWVGDYVPKEGPSPRRCMTADPRAPGAGRLTSCIGAWRLAGFGCGA